MSYTNVKNQLYHGHRKIANNTYLTLTDAYDQPGMLRSECIEMRLHGNLIARFHPDYLELYSAGWHTQTTKDRLNLALDIALVAGRKIYQSSQQWYYGDLYHEGDLAFREGMKVDYQGNVILQGA